MATPQPPPDGADTDRPREDLSAVRAEAERLQAAIESIPDPLAISDAENRLALHNSAFRELMAETGYVPQNGTPWEQVIAKTASLFVFESDAERGAFFAKRFAARMLPADSYETRLTRGRTFRVSARAIPGGGRVTIATDLTEDLRRERELEIARREAEAANRAKSEFLASMSHELRTPLNAVLGFAQLLLRDRRERLTDRQREMVQQIYGGGDHLLRLIDDVLDLARLDAKWIAISKEPVSAAALLGEVIETLRPAADKAAVTLKRDDAPEGLPAIHADPGRYKQILMNLGSNAIKYNRRGGAATFRLSARGGRVRATVIDTGIGVASEHHAQLFQPFFRAGQETGPIDGTGIGLAISRRLAEMMGGSMGFQSALGRGSEFWVELPAHASEAQVPASNRSLEPPPPSLGKLRALVLYIEDHPPNVALMADVVSGVEGVELVTASTAEAGLQIARARRPDVIVMDINLPRMSGLEALRLLRSWDDTRDVPVIALTAAAAPEARERGLRAGFFRYLVKPVRIEDLERALEEALR